VHARAEHSGDASDIRGLFDRVLCGVDGSRGSIVAVHQAATLVAPDGELTLISATAGGIRGTLSAEQARDALVAGHELARAFGAPEASLKLVGAGDAARRVIEEAEGYDLAVVGAPRGTRAGGIARRSVSTELVHRARPPVLVARPCLAGTGFPGDMVVASDGSANGWSAVRLTRSLAELYDGRMTLVVCRDDEAIDVEVAASAALESFAAAGIEPAVSTPQGKPVDQIVLAAYRASASLLVIGSRERSGVQAHANVSEQVAHRAWCSVLVSREWA
jgi:nucleotide-binding universal stress UspA family protein